jgi:predicted transcriptional regulator
MKIKEKKLISGHESTRQLLKFEDKWNQEAVEAYRALKEGDIEKYRQICKGQSTVEVSVSEQTKQPEKMSLTPFQQSRIVLPIL